MAILKYYIDPNQEINYFINSLDAKEKPLKCFYLLEFENEDRALKIACFHP